MLQTVITIAQAILAVLLIAAVLLQQKGAGLGAAFGGSGTMFTTKRGVDLVLHKATIIISIVFFGLALLSHIV
jgi:preprotein translocase subunit SecG